jgi:hypothetical protein
MRDCDREVMNRRSAFCAVQCSIFVDLFVVYWFRVGLYVIMEEEDFGVWERDVIGRFCGRELDLA